MSSQSLGVSASFLSILAQEPINAALLLLELSLLLLVTKARPYLDTKLWRQILYSKSHVTL